MFHNALKKKTVSKGDNGLKGLHLILLAFALIVSGFGLLTSRAGGEKIVQDNITAIAAAALKADEKTSSYTEKITIEHQGSQVILSGKVPKKVQAQALKVVRKSLEGEGIYKVRFAPARLRSHTGGTTGIPISIQISTSSVNGGYDNLTAVVQYDPTNLKPVTAGYTGGTLVIFTDTTQGEVVGQYFIADLASVTAPPTNATIPMSFMYPAMHHDNISISACAAQSMTAGTATTLQSLTTPINMNPPTYTVP